MFAVKSDTMSNIDKYMIEKIGLKGAVLMENAAKTLVDQVVKDFPLDKMKNSSILILCGTGNNGGDGLCASRWLTHKGYNVLTILVGDQEKLSSEAALQMSLLIRLNRAFKEDRLYFYEENQLDQLIQQVGQARIIIDAMIGSGCHRTLSAKIMTLVRQVNQSKAFVYAVDVPTGINSDNGREMGCAVKADVTVTFCLPKLGLVLFPGCNYVGKLIVADIGIFEEALSVIDNPIELIDYSTLMDLKSQKKLARTDFSHKGTFGTVGIIAGDRHMLGATLLCAKAAYRSGAGLVKIFVAEELSATIINGLPECILVSYDKEMAKEAFDQELENFVLSSDALIIGPGLSNSLKARHMVHKVLQLDTKVVLDADALNIISEHLEWFEDRICQAVITPHIGEMARLTGYPSSGISENTLQFAEAFAAKYAVTTVLKSARTIIVSKEGRRYINLLGNSGMATAGSGDVLAGVIGALIGMGANLSEASMVGVLLHSLAGDQAADKLGKHPLMASDIIDCLWKKIGEN